MTTAGNKQVGKLFRRLADYSLLHLGDAKARAGFRTLPELSAVVVLDPMALGQALLG